MSWTTIYARSARKDLKRLPSKDRERIGLKIAELAAGAENLDVKRLQGKGSDQRLRVGNYRVIFRYDADGRELQIESVRRRNEATFRVRAWLTLWSGL